jgi:hypothetical protein
VGPHPQCLPLGTRRDGWANLDGDLGGQVDPGEPGRRGDYTHSHVAAVNPAGLSATWWEVFTTGVTYNYYTSPNNTFNSFANVEMNFSLNDSKWLGAVALNPSLFFAFETKGEALASADRNKGIYMSLGLAPGYTVFEDSSVSFNVSAPLTFAFSVKDYNTVDSKN